MYLTPEAVADTLSAVAGLTPPAQPGTPPSRLVFDAWVPSSGSLRAAVRRGTSHLLGLIGEPFKFALAPDEAPRMLARAGWRVRALHDRAGLASGLGLPSAAIYPDVCVVDAERAPAPEPKESP